MKNKTNVKMEDMQNDQYQLEKTIYKNNAWLSGHKRCMASAQFRQNEKLEHKIPPAGKTLDGQSGYRGYNQM